MKWNYEGWAKAFVLWNFILSSSVAVQKLIIHIGLIGLLPGKRDMALGAVSGTILLHLLHKGLDRLSQDVYLWLHNEIRDY